MAENTTTSPISQSVTEQPVPVKIAKETEPDMDVLEWAKKYIEIPEMRARLSGLPVQEIEPKRRIRNRTSSKTMPKADHVQPDKPEVQNTSREDTTTTSGTRLVERKTEIIGTGFPPKRVSARVASDLANRAMFEQYDREMVRLRLMIDELRFRLDDRDAGRRSR
ncbi:MAG: hypothetical protein WC295_06750 [Methanoregula sp.]|nr:hypothetical protein [Methanoregula sp.]